MCAETKFTLCANRPVIGGAELSHMYEQRRRLPYFANRLVTSGAELAHYLVTAVASRGEHVGCRLMFSYNLSLPNGHIAG